MCDLDMLEGVRQKMKARSWRVVVNGADHGMNVKPKKGTKGVGELVGKVAAEWFEECDDERREGRIWLEGEAEHGAVWSGWEVGTGEPVNGVDVKADKKKSSKEGSKTKRLARVQAETGEFAKEVFVKARKRMKSKEETGEVRRSKGLQ